MGNRIGDNRRIAVDGRIGCHRVSFAVTIGDVIGLGRGHQALDVEQDQHAVVLGADAGDEAGIDGGAEFGGGADLVGVERDDVGDAVDDDADDASRDTPAESPGGAEVVSLDKWRK